MSEEYITIARAYDRINAADRNTKKSTILDRLEKYVKVSELDAALVTPEERIRELEDKVNRLTAQLDTATTGQLDLPLGEPPPQMWLSTREIMDKFSISRSLLYRLIRNDLVQYSDVGKKERACYRIEAGSVREYLRKEKV